MPEFTRPETAKLIAHAPKELVETISEDTMPMSHSGIEKLDVDFSPEELLKSGLFQLIDEDHHRYEMSPDDSIPNHLILMPDGFGWSTRRINDSSEYEFVMTAGDELTDEYSELVTTVYEEWVEQVVERVNKMFELSTLSRRQFQVFVLDGANPEKKTAELLDISVGTVRSHKQRAYEKVRNHHYKVQRYERAAEVHSTIRNAGSKDTVVDMEERENRRQAIPDGVDPDSEKSVKAQIYDQMGSSDEGD